jgi:hypothetical protein
MSIFSKLLDKLFRSNSPKIERNSIWAVIHNEGSPWHARVGKVVVTDIKDNYVRYSYYNIEGKIPELYGDTSTTIETFIRIYHNTGLFIA